MKKIFVFLFFFILTSCQKPSAWDSKNYPIGQYKLENIKPGDDFYMYCNGKYWNNTETDSMSGFFGYESVDLMYEHYNIVNVNGPVSEKYYANLEKWKNSTSVDNTTFTNELKSMLDIVDGINDRNSLVSAFHTLSLKGANIPFGITITPIGNTAFLQAGTDFFPLTQTYFNNSYIIYSALACKEFLEDLGLSKTEAEDNAKRANVLRNQIDSAFLTGLISIVKAQTDNKLELWLDELDKYAENQSNKLATKSIEGNSLLEEIIKSFGIDMQYVIIDQLEADSFAILEESDLEDVKALLRTNIAFDYVFVSDTNKEKYFDIVKQNNSGNLSSVTTDFTNYINSLVNYPLSYEWSNKYIDEQGTSKFYDYCQQLKTTFANRIDKLDWMSDATKQKAKEKLSVMGVEVNVPKEWIKEAIPSLKGDTFAESLIEMRIAHNNGILKLAGKSLTDNVMNLAYLISIAGANTCNAFYQPVCNSIVILPSMTMYPFYDSNRSEAINYAMTLTIVGHELTHGFDSKGSKYNAKGEVQNWWTASDKMEFEDRYQKLIRNHSNLELYPNSPSGIFVNGTKTITEDIADLGGILIAYDAYMAELAKQSYFGESLEIQKRKFFESFAELWRAKYTEETAKQLDSYDLHSQKINRVNGTVMNVDAWYDLYDVQWGDALYLPENRRARIW